MFWLEFGPSFQGLTRKNRSHGWVLGSSLLWVFRYDMIFRFEWFWDDAKLPRKSKSKKPFPLVESGIRKRMVHPKDQSLFGLGLPGNWIWLVIVWVVPFGIVTTRIFTSFMFGDPYEPSFATIFRWMGTTQVITCVSFPSTTNLDHMFRGVFCQAQAIRGPHLVVARHNTHKLPMMASSTSVKWCLRRDMIIGLFMCIDREERFRYRSVGR